MSGYWDRHRTDDPPPEYGTTRKTALPGASREAKRQSGDGLQSDTGEAVAHLSQIAAREVSRALALTIAYKAAVDDNARLEVFAGIRDALQTAHAALRAESSHSSPNLGAA